MSSLKLTLALQVIESRSKSNVDDDSVHGRQKAKNRATRISTLVSHPCHLLFAAQLIHSGRFTELDRFGRVRKGNGEQGEECRRKAYQSIASLASLVGFFKPATDKAHLDFRLLTLKNVISKLAEQSAKKTTGHIPYRDSKL